MDKTINREGEIKRPRKRKSEINLKYQIMRERKRGKRQIQGLREKEIRRQRKTKKGDGKKEMDRQG